MGKGQAIAGFVLAIVGTVLSFFGAIGSFLALPISVVGLVLAIIGGKKLKENQQSRGFATAGLVIGIIAVALSSISFLTCGICVLCATGSVGGCGMLFEELLG